MGDFFTAQIDYVYFVYGLVFMLLAGASRDLRRLEVSRLPWTYLMWFGVVHGLNEWLEMLAITLGNDGGEIQYLRVGSMGLSFLILAEFARRGWMILGHRKFPIWGFWAAAAGGLAAAPGGVDALSAWWRLLLAVPATWLAGWVFISLGRRAPVKRRGWLLVCGVLMILYGMTQCVVPPAEMRPWGLPTTDDFLAATHIPIQVFRVLIVGALAMVLRMREMASLPWELKGTDRTWVTSPQWWVWIVLPMVVGMGWGLTQWLGEYGRDNERIQHQETLRLEMTRFSSMVTMADRMAQALAKDPATVGLMTMMSAAAAEDVKGEEYGGYADMVLDRFAALTPDVVCFLMNKNGLTVASSNRMEPTSFVGNNYSYRTYFQEALRSGIGTMMAVGITTREPGYFTAAAVEGDDREACGVAVVKVKLLNLPIVKHTGGMVMLVDDTDQVLMCNRGGLMNIPLWGADPMWTSKEWLPDRKAVLKNKPEDGDILRLEGVMHLVVHHATNIPGWRVVELMPLRHEPVLRLLAIGSIAMVCFLVVLAHATQSRSQRDAQLLLDSETRYRSLVEGSPYRVELYDPQGRLLAINQASLRKMGWKREQVVGRLWTEIWPAEAHEKLREALKQLALGQAVELEMEIPDGEGKRTVFDIAMNPGFDPNHGLTHFVCLAGDVTDRVRAHEDLRLHRTKLAESMDMARLAHWDFNAGTDEFELDRQYFRLIHHAKIEEEKPRIKLDDFAKRWLAEDDAAEFVQRLRQAVASQPPGSMWQFEARIQRAGHQTAYVQVRFRALRDEEGRVLRLAGVSQDITELKKAEEALRRSEQRYALAERGTNDGLWDWDLESDQVYFSPRALEMLGAEGQTETTPTTWFDRIDPSDATQFQADLTFHLAGRTTHFHNEHRIIRPDGSVRWIFSRGLAIRDNKGVAMRMAGAISDITDRKCVEEQLRQAAQTDRLTGLVNRPVILDQIDRAIRRTRVDAHHRFAVFFLDFDRFKIINDSLGHAVGDQLLIEIARRLTGFVHDCPLLPQHTRDISRAARLGGDEFVILLNGLANTQEVGQIAEMLLEDLSKPYHLRGHDVRSTASIGITTSDSGHRNADEVVRDADTAMYRAKATGKARSVMFDNAMHTEVASRLALENDLRKALGSQQLYLHYQPLVSLASGQLLGFEALLRWNHPSRGMVSPSEFIPLAEETGLIIPLGSWVMEEAIRQLREWQEKNSVGENIRLNVNLSRCQLLHSGLIPESKRIVEKMGINARMVHLEITESVVMENTDHILPVLKELKSLGFHLDMDDFGTGHSSLACLHRFPVDGLKIDRSFIRNMTDHPDYSAVVHAIVTLAHSLNMTVTAEGVETPEQVAQLQSLDCDNAQGFYFAKALPPGEAAAFIRKNNSFLRMSA